MSRRRPKRGPYDVVFYVPWLSPLLSAERHAPTGGAETQIYLVAKALAAQGVRVCLVVFDTAEGLPDRVGDVDVEARVPYSGGAGWGGRLREVAETFRSLAKLDAPVFVTRVAGPNVGLVAASAKLARRRFVYSSANVSDFDFHLVEPMKRNRALYEVGMRLADKVVVQTDEQAELCRTVYGHQAVVIRSIAEPAERSADSKPSAFLWVARLASYKHPLKFVELARRVPEAKFRMVGMRIAPLDDELIEEVERRAADLPNLEVLPPRPRRELLPLVDEAVAMVNTSDFEGMPNTLLEGWVRGVPALVLRHDPDGVISKHGLGLYADGDEDLLAEQARQLWAERDNGSELRARCIDYTQRHHSPDAVAGRWRQVFAELTRTSPRTARDHEVVTPHSPGSEA